MSQESNPGQEHASSYEMIKSAAIEFQNRFILDHGELTPAFFAQEAQRMKRLSSDDTIKLNFELRVRFDEMNTRSKLIAKIVSPYKLLTNQILKDTFVKDVKNDEEFRRLFPSNSQILKIYDFINLLSEAELILFNVEMSRINRSNSNLYIDDIEFQV